MTAILNERGLYRCSECGNMTDSNGEAEGCYGNYCSGAPECNACGYYSCSGDC